VRDWINRLRAARWIKLGSPAMDDHAERGNRTRPAAGQHHQSRGLARLPAS
jgi:hypothetical protein